jgi:hypothetical protein
VAVLGVALQQALRVVGSDLHDVDTGAVDEVIHVQLFYVSGGSTESLHHLPVPVGEGGCLPHGNRVPPPQTE